MSYIAEKFKELGVVPIVVLENTKDALPLAKALMEAGWLKEDLVKAGDFDKIQELTKEAKELAKSIR